MSRIRLLVKYYIKDSSTNKRIKNPFVKVVLILIMAFAFSAPVSAAVAISYGDLYKIGMESSLIYLILGLGSIMALLMGISTVLSVMFFEDDVEIMLPLPFKAYEITLSKFIVIYINMAVINAVTILPLITYGISSGANIFYYIAAIIVAILNPIFPMLICILISLILMRVSNISKHKDAIQTVMSLILILIVIGFEFFNSNGNSKIIGKMTETHSKGIVLINRIFFTNIFEKGSLTGNYRLISLIILIAIVGILIFILGFIGNKIYLNSIIGSSEVVKRNKKSKTINYVKSNSIMKTLILKDIKVVLRTSAFKLNCIIMLFYLPVIYFVVNGKFEFPHKTIGFFMLSCLIFGVISTASSAGASTTMSRDGKDLLVSKYIPVPYKDIVKAKINVAIILNSVVLILGIIVIIFSKVPLIYGILGFIIEALGLLFMTLCGTLTDFRKPKVLWDREKDLFRRNYKTLGLMIGGAIFSLIMAIIGIFIKNGIIDFIVFAIILIALSGILYRLNIKCGQEAYRNVK